MKTKPIADSRRQLEAAPSGDRTERALAMQITLSSNSTGRRNVREHNH